MKNTRTILFLIALAFIASLSRAAEVIPPAPARHFNDYANIVPAQTAQTLDKKLEDFEKETSNQVLVVIYPKMQSDSSIEDYTVRVAHKWGVGQKDRDNGAVLFVFSQDRKLFIQVGYGLEGALPDALAKQIIENEITPRFKSGDFAGGLSAGIDAIMAATKGEYKALPPKNNVNHENDSGWGFLVIIVVFIIFMIIARRSGSRSYGRRGVGWMPIFLPPMGGSGRSSGGWGSGGGGWGGGGGGGFSGGGGGFGGGGAGGSW